MFYAWGCSAWAVSNHLHP